MPENKETEEGQLSEEEIVEETRKALKKFHEEAPETLAGITTYIKNDETSDTWFYAEDKNDLMTLYLLLIIQLAEYLGENKFDLILSIQSRLAELEPDEYEEYFKKMQDIGEEIN